MLAWPCCGRGLVADFLKAGAGWLLTLGGAAVAFVAVGVVLKLLWRCLQFGWGLL
jgi:hypothetical protein